jgi:hypothetical protein
MKWLEALVRSAASHAALPLHAACTIHINSHLMRFADSRDSSIKCVWVNK